MKNKTLKPFLKLIKHGIILGNLVPVIAGFFLALTPQTPATVILLLTTMIGITFVIASATITNNIIDRDIDKLMQRTQNRPLVNGDISLTIAILLAIFFGITGFYLLYFHVNTLAGNLALIGFIDYVILYSLIFKRHSSFSILIGSISGAIPPLVGYVAITNQLDLTMLYLFITFSSWQIAHSYAIALYRKQDYQKASIPISTLAMPFKTAQRWTALYIAIMVISVLLLVLQSFHFTLTKIITILLISYWLYQAIKTPTLNDTSLWGKQQFINSLLIIMGLCLLMIIDHLLIFL